MSTNNIPAADFSAIIPQAPDGEEGTSTDPSNAREPIPHQPLVTQIPTYDPAASLAEQLAQVIGEPAPQRDPQFTQTATEFPSQTPPSPQSPSGEGEGGGVAVSGSPAAPPDPSLDASVDPPADPPTDPSSTEFSLDSLAQQMYGRPATRDEALAIMQLWNDAQQLTPEQRHQVAVTMGYVQDDNTATNPHQPSTSHSPPAPSTTPSPPAPPDDTSDPYIDPYIAPIREDITNLRDQVQSLVSDRQLTTQQQLERQANDTLQAFREAHPEFTEEEHAALQLRANRDILAHYQHSNDLPDSITRALEGEMWRDDNYRAKILEVQRQQTEQTATNDTQRQQRAASLSPGGAQVPRDEPASPPPVVDRLEARKGMAEELAGIMDQQ